MNFHEIKVGSPSVYPPTNRLRVPFALPSPVQTAHAVLKSFHLRLDDGDSEVRDVVVMLTTHFDPFQSTTSGEVEVEFQRTDSGAGLVLQSDLIEAEIRILLISI